MYQINVVTYRTAINVKNAPRRVVNIEKGMLKRKFQSVELARKALKEFFNKIGYQIGNEVKEKDNETYVKTLFFDNVILKTEYKIIKCN
jgi:hypothetical protein